MSQPDIALSAEDTAQRQAEMRWALRMAKLRRLCLLLGLNPDEGTIWTPVTIDHAQLLTIGMLPSAPMRDGWKLVTSTKQAEFRGPRYARHTDPDAALNAALVNVMQAKGVEPPTEA